MQTIAIAVLALASAGALFQLIGTRRSARTCAAPGSMIDAGDHRLHAVSAGCGSPSVLLEAGIAASSLSWTYVLPRVATFARVSAYDRAGLGWSDPDPHPRTFARVVDDLDTVIAKTTPPPYVLVGHSFGCFVICALAAKYP